MANQPIIGCTGEPLVDVLLELAGADSSSVQSMTLSVKAGEVVTLTVEHFVCRDRTQKATQFLKLCRAEPLNG